MRGGGNYHEITVAEWAAIALWCHRNGAEPKGNNSNGKDQNETLYRAIPSCERNSLQKVQRVATGTGPVTWSHDGTLSGIWDMNGNIREWCTGLRLVYGELQILKDNDAADPAVDLSSTSNAWKAIRASDGALVIPDGNGTTEGTVKLDWQTNRWVYSTGYTKDPSSHSCAFKDVSADGTIGAAAQLLLQSLAMLPDAALKGDGIDMDYGRDVLNATNNGAERCPSYGGSWAYGNGGGVFSIELRDTRNFNAGNTGGRSALYK